MHKLKIVKRASKYLLAGIFSFLFFTNCALGVGNIEINSELITSLGPTGVIEFYLYNPLTVNPFLNPTYFDPTSKITPSTINANVYGGYNQYVFDAYEGDITIRLWKGPVWDGTTGSDYSIITTALQLDSSGNVPAGAVPATIHFGGPLGILEYRLESATFYKAAVPDQLPTLTSVLSGYTPPPDFKPIATAGASYILSDIQVTSFVWHISGGGLANPINTELQSTIYPGQAISYWNTLPHPNNELMPADISRTYTISATPKNWFGLGSQTATLPLEVPSPGGAQPLLYNLNLTFSGGNDQGLLTWTYEGAERDFDMYMADSIVGAWIPAPEILSGLTPIAAGEFSFPVSDLTAYVDDQHAIRYLRVVPQGQAPGAYPNEVVGLARYVLPRSTDINTGITSISMPFSVTYGYSNGTTVALARASNLREVIGAAFQFVSGWDETAQKELYFAIDRDNNLLGDQNMPLLPGRGYQVSVGPDPNLPNLTTQTLILVGK